uniref:Uncharacterized protein n=1 Tax=Elaeophora elaphi TaxID=1147741 RepID=A0A0R3S7E2_9BILA
MAVQQWMLLGSKKRKRRQIRMRTNAVGRWKQQRVRKLRVQHLLKESSASAGIIKDTRKMFYKVNNFWRNKKQF